MIYKPRNLFLKVSISTSKLNGKDLNNFSKSLTFEQMSKQHQNESTNNRVCLFFETTLFTCLLRLQNISKIF